MYNDLNGNKQQQRFSFRNLFKLSKQDSSQNTIKNNNNNDISDHNHTEN